MKKYLVFLILPGMVACGPQERVSKEAFEAVNKGMEIKRVSEAEIIKEAMSWGDSITLEAQQLLLGALQKSIQEHGLPGAVQFCNGEALPLLDSLGKGQFSIRRVTNRYRNPNNQPNEDEKPILEAYEYNAEAELKSEPNVQNLPSDEALLYTKPIIIASGLCLSCHGKEKSDISEEVLEVLGQYYPRDLAKGYALGEFRGMWAVKLPKKEVVRRL